MVRLLNNDIESPPESWLLEYNDLIRYYLWDIGITNEESANQWLTLNNDVLCSAYWMKDLDVAINLLEHSSSVLVWGDYDVDGITSTSIMEHALIRCGFDVSTHIPSRSDGYGITVDNLKKVLGKRHFDCIITVDCGIRSHKVADWIKSNLPSTKYIVTDHHDVEENELPNNADAVIDPKQMDCRYPNPDLSGAGIAYKFAFALHERTSTVMSIADHSYYLALASMGIVADMMTILHPEQRYIVREGLSVLNTAPPEGVGALLKAMRYNSSETVTPITIGFVIAPPLNAASRMGDVNLAYDLLRSRLASGRTIDYDDVASQLVKLNNKRKKVQGSASAEAIRSVRESAEELQPIVITTVPSSDAPEGLMGLIASNINDAFHRPAIVLTEKIEGDTHFYTGSARSVTGYDITAAISSADSLLDRYGGHEGAAGLKLLKSNYDQFVEIVTKHAEEYAPDPDLIAPVGNIEISLSMVSWNTYNVLFLLHPYTGENAPIFESMGVISQIAPIGARGGVRATLIDPMNGAKASGVCFSANYKKMPMIGDTVFVTYKLRHDTFAGANDIIMDILWMRVDNTINLKDGKHFESLNPKNIRNALGSGSRRRI